MTGASGGEMERQAFAEQNEAATRRVRETVGRMLRDGLPHHVVLAAWIVGEHAGAFGGRPRRGGGAGDIAGIVRHAGRACYDAVGAAMPVAGRA